VDVTVLLEQQIERAWQEVNADAQHRLRPVTRLGLYDLLIGDLETPLYELVRLGLTFPRRTAGLKRYFYLGMMTVERVFPIWEQSIDEYVDVIDGEADPEQTVRDFPYIIHHFTVERLKGRPADEIEFRGRDEWGDYFVAEWHYAIGNLTEALLYQHGMVIDAVYDLCCAVDFLGLPVTWPKRATTAWDALSDSELGIHCDDFAYHASEAYACNDPNSPGWVDWWEWEGLPIKRDNGKTLEFWHWWLFEAIPEAARVDLEQLNWASE
jgi:hypothetical protein